MASDTITQELAQYRIGAKIRALRLKKKIGLAELGKHTGFSAALLSKIERDRLFPTLPTLLRIAMVFGVGLDYFFVEGVDRPSMTVVRKKDRLRLPDRAGKNPLSYTFESLVYPVTDRTFDAYYAEFQALPSELHTHQGAELIYVLHGQLGVTVGGEHTTLDQGDVLYFDSGTPHGYQRQGRSTCAAIVIIAPR